MKTEIKSSYINCKPRTIHPNIRSIVFGYYEDKYLSFRPLHLYLQIRF